MKIFEKQNWNLPRITRFHALSFVVANLLYYLFFNVNPANIVNYFAGTAVNLTASHEYYKLYQLAYEIGRYTMIVAFAFAPYLFFRYFKVNEPELQSIGKLCDVFWALCFCSRFQWLLYTIASCCLYVIIVVGIVCRYRIV